MSDPLVLLVQCLPAPGAALKAVSTVKVPLAEPLAWTTTFWVPATKPVAEVAAILAPDTIDIEVALMRALLFASTRVLPELKVTVPVVTVPATYMLAPVWWVMAPV